MMKLTVKQVKACLDQVITLDDPILKQLGDDSRKGVQHLIAITKNRLQKEQLALNQFHRRFKYEENFWHHGVRYIAGVDEVGRGPLAGPVVSAAVILPRDFDLIRVTDSKQLKPAVRAQLVPQIKREALSIGIGLVDNSGIDRLNIYEATRVAMKQAVEQLRPQPDEIIVDAMTIDVPIHQTRLIKGDAKSISVSAASIVAKVYRDTLMDQYARKYPEYDFNHNAGYGTANHLAALKKYGATPIHRKTFAPVKNLLHK
ncbi:ribonuclease HII [Lentilactobacillus farraginis]|uniref:Ribonuclease HII n=2 Tax=Lentilactobacillus farraginis DSM 18382 = JCM 14108 TaxID=1423743 RepID=X0Q9Z6_9LACO|nr:ribonuclease HII [Lentilactobacillus farraginis]GAF35415.1 ribonuclease HII [Lentilactobacillus farraginis DSM 18382 = JCM 14108]